MNFQLMFFTKKLHFLILVTAVFLNRFHFPWKLLSVSTWLTNMVIRCTFIDKLSMIFYLNKYLNFFQILKYILQTLLNRFRFLQQVSAKALNTTFLISVYQLHWLIVTIIPYNMWQVVVANLLRHFTLSFSRTLISNSS